MRLFSNPSGLRLWPRAVWLVGGQLFQHGTQVETTLGQHQTSDRQRSYLPDPGRWEWIIITPLRIVILFKNNSNFFFFLNVEKDVCMQISILILNVFIIAIFPSILIYCVSNSNCFRHGKRIKCQSIKISLAECKVVKIQL